MFVRKSKKKFDNNSRFEKENSGKFFKYKCHNCRKVGHMAVNCPEKKEKASIVEDVSFLAATSLNVALNVEPNMVNDLYMVSR